MYLEIKKNYKKNKQIFKSLIIKDGRNNFFNLSFIGTFGTWYQVIEINILTK